MSRLLARYTPVILGCKQIGVNIAALLDGVPGKCYNHTHPNNMEGVHLHGDKTLGWEI